MKQIKLLNIIIIQFPEIINSLKITGRIRLIKNRLITILKKAIINYNDEKLVILEKYARKDEKGEPIIKNKIGGMVEYDLDEEKKEKFIEELQVLNMSIVDVDIFPADKDLFDKVPVFIDDILGSDSLEFSGREEAIFENIKKSFSKTEEKEKGPVLKEEK